MTKLVDATGKPLPPEEAPDAERLRAYGDAMFLVFRSGYHNRMNVTNLRFAFEPPLVLGQYKIFRFDGVPRAICTWALLAPDAEKRYIQGELLNPLDWKSEGGRLWLIDLIAPYNGLMPSIWKWGMVPGNVSEKGFRYCRHEIDRRNRRIVDVSFEHPGRTLRILSDQDFL